jgi:hypothetical protein
LQFAGVGSVPYACAALAIAFASFESSLAHAPLHASALLSLLQVQNPKTATIRNNEKKIFLVITVCLRFGKALAFDYYIQILKRIFLSGMGRRYMSIKNRYGKHARNREKRGKTIDTLMF